ncbi:TPA: hypothetical protein QCX40_005747 [Bacillus cereus]|nr:hypothetical protein [Bacillus cereus]
MLQLNKDLELGYNLLKDYENKFSNYALATLYIKYNILFMALNIKVDTETPESKVEVFKAANLVQDHYLQSNRKKESIQENVASKNYHDLKVLQYDEKKYREIYFETGKLIQNDVTPVSKKISNLITPGKVYMYAVNAQMEPIIYTKPIPVQDLIFGRQRLKLENKKIAHPVLLHNYNQMAIGAGEVIFIRNNNNEIAGLILNNKSGHFRPSGQTLTTVKEAFIKKLNLNSNNIITIEVEKNW